MINLNSFYLKMEANMEEYEEDEGDDTEDMLEEE